MRKIKKEVEWVCLWKMGIFRQVWWWEHEVCLEELVGAQWKQCQTLFLQAPKSLQMVTVLSSSVAQSCRNLCDPMNRSMPGLPVHHQLLEFTQIHVHWVGDAIQPFHPLSSPSPPALNLSQHQGFLKWVSSSHQVAKVLEFELQHQSFQWTPRTDLL